MSKNIYVGNLSWGTQENDLYNLFAQYGEVSSARIIIDRESGRSKGFGFVEMPADDAAETAISALNGADVDGRNIRVNESESRENRRSNSYNYR